MRYWIKLVPDAEPNADGYWTEVEAEPDTSGPPYLWLKSAARFAKFEPEGYHLVSIHSSPPEPEPEPEPPLGNRFSGLDLDGAS